MNGVLYTQMIDSDDEVVVGISEFSGNSDSSFWSRHQHHHHHHWYTITEGESQRMNECMYFAEALSKNIKVY